LEQKHDRNETFRHIASKSACQQTTMQINDRKQAQVDGQRQTHLNDGAMVVGVAVQPQQIVVQRRLHEYIYKIVVGRGAEKKTNERTRTNAFAKA
jgi:hypothetical protein